MMVCWIIWYFMEEKVCRKFLRLVLCWSEKLSELTISDFFWETRNFSSNSSDDCCTTALMGRGRISQAKSLVKPHWLHVNVLQYWTVGNCNQQLVLDLFLTFKHYKTICTTKKNCKVSVLCLASDQWFPCCTDTGVMKLVLSWMRFQMLWNSSGVEVSA